MTPPWPLPVSFSTTVGSFDAASSAASSAERMSPASRPGPTGRSGCSSVRCRIPRSPAWGHRVRARSPRLRRSREELDVAGLVGSVEAGQAAEGEVDLAGEHGGDLVGAAVVVNDVQVDAEFVLEDAQVDVIITGAGVGGGGDGSGASSAASNRSSTVS